MRHGPIVLALGGATLVACAPVAPYDDTRERAELSTMLAGRVAGAPQACIADYSDTQMDSYGNDIVFRVGNDIYVNRTEGGCQNASMGGHTFVVERFGGAGTLCRNTNVKVIVASTGMFAGSCTLGDFVPYKRP